jgi:DNA polymerase-3 subunit gamma/tau
MNRNMALARKYRPKALQDIIGQDDLVQALTKGLQEGRIPQAILLNGIRGTGKTTTARILARSVNCLALQGSEKMTVTPCCACKSCLAIDNDSHVDVIEMDAASHTGVDDVREIIDSSRYKAVLGRYKVFIIDEIHMLSKSAFNALLKTLEEPPAHVLFIFATTEINKIPETILSRCARFDLKRVNSKALIAHMKNIAGKEGYEIENDACALIARLAEGSVRDSLTLLDQAMSLVGGDGEVGALSEAVVPTSSTTGSHDKPIIRADLIRGMLGGANRQTVFEVLSCIFARNEVALIAEVRKLLVGGADPQMIMQDLLECLYHSICFKILPKMSADESIPELDRELASKIARDVDNMRLLSLWKVLLKSWIDIKSAPFADQALEIGLLRACFAFELPSVDELLAKLGEPTRLQQQSGNTINQGVVSEVLQEEAKVVQKEPRVAQEVSRELREESKEPQEKPNIPAEPLEPPKICQVNELTNFQELSTVATEQDLLSLLKEQREALLLSYIENDFAFVSVSPGKICVQVRNKDAMKIIPSLKMFLLKQTGLQWSIEESESDEPLQTNAEKRRSFLLAEEEKILETPFVQRVKQLFPQAKFEFEERTS